MNSDLDFLDHFNDGKNMYLQGLMSRMALCLPIAAMTGCSSPAPHTDEAGGKSVDGAAKGSKLLQEDIHLADISQLRPSDPVPKTIHTVVPVLSREALARRLQGDVRVEVRVGADGKVFDVRVLNSVDKLLSQPVVDALKQWIYSPLLRDGIPTAFAAKQTITIKVEAAR